MKTPLVCILPALLCLGLPGPPPARAEDEPAAARVFAAAERIQPLIAAKQWDEASARLRGLIDDPRNAADDPAVANLRLLLADVYLQNGKPADALAEAVAAAGPLERALGRENPIAMKARWGAARAALAAARPGDAAVHADALLATLRDHVGSGRAAAARWEEVPAFKPLLDQIPRLDEAGVATVAALAGRAHAAAGDDARALPLLQEAAAMLEKHAGPGHPDLVAAREALEAVAARRGEALGRRYVGVLGASSKLVFEGQASFSADQLHAALGRDPSFVLASHPAAECAAFLEVLRQRLWLGYRNSGFPQATIETALAPGADGGRAVARIVEGPRYRMGEIRIAGTRETDPDRLRAALLDADAAGPEQTMAALFRKTMAAYENLLPKLEEESTQASAAALMPGTPGGDTALARSNQIIQYI
jgi:hypothetical protein